ncbi:MAG: tetratricopeptide repeat protein [Bacteroidia bacterium]|nr:tetratricopeptide repeat protein [Bacteroidia bacterium]
MTIRTKYIAAIAAFILTAGAYNVQAQKSRVKGIYQYLDQAQPELLNAKIDIDKALLDPSTSNWGPMWFWRGKTYSYIAAFDLKLAPNAGTVASESFINYFNSADKRDSDEESLVLDGDQPLILVAGDALLREGLKLADEKKYTEAISKYELLVKLIPFDRNKILASKANITINQAYLAAYVAANADSNVVLSRVYLQKLIDNNYLDYTIYLMMSDTYKKQGDYEKALKYLEDGKNLFEDRSKDFLIEEINIYIDKGETDILFKKFSEAIAQDETNALLYQNRGILYQRKNNYKLAIADYKKAIELSPESQEPVYSLASVYIDSAAVFTNQMNNIKNIESEQYKTAYKNASAMFSMALPMLENIYSTGYITNIDEQINLLRSIRDSYKFQGNEAKRAEYNGYIGDKLEEQKKMKAK